MIVGIAKALGHVGGEHVALDGLGHARFDRFGEVLHIRGQDHVGRGAPAFREQPLGHPGVEKGDVDLDAGLGGEGVDQRLDQLGLAVGIDVDLGQRRQGGGEAERGGEGESEGHARLLY